ncbi:MAG: cysteine--tRNA ligase [Candidatus Methanomethyliaceae archaeon]|nr:cysteine--tRNA ligase [Candidatus Methanomethyliaceae archaeon]
MGDMMRIFNTRTGVKEFFIPQDPFEVKVYVCGPTVYDLCHVGHARTYVNFDVLKRYLTSLGYNVIHVQNFTDIDEKIDHRAKKEGLSPREVAERFIMEYFFDMDSLNVTRATRYTKASEYVPKIIKITERLLELGYAYRSGDAIYFDVEGAGGFGELVRDLKSAIVDEVRASGKRGPFDFVLWRITGEGFESPFGRGVPGWHTECVAMSMDNLGEVLDIHWGGKDLIYPHHECEALIAKALTGKRFVKYWVHNEFVLLKGQKMSKSSGERAYIRDVLKRYSAEVLRTWILSSNYREKIEFSEESLRKAQLLYEKISRAATKARGNEGMGQCAKDYAELFMSALDDDLETGQALSVVEELSDRVLEGKIEGAWRIFSLVESVLGIKIRPH